MKTTSACQVASDILFRSEGSQSSSPNSNSSNSSLSSNSSSSNSYSSLSIPRRRFFRDASLAATALTCADFLRYFKAFGAPRETTADRLADQAVSANDHPRFLTYWFLEGGWCGYDMFNPVMTANHIHKRLDRISDERYRVLRWGEADYTIYEKGNIRYGYLASEGKDLMKDMAVISSMHTGSGHSRDRLKVHMGHYDLRQSDERQDDERSVMQAFSEVYGQNYLLPNLSWHWWLSDGELNEVQYRGRRGYYHGLGPVHAHTLYAGTPAKLKRMIRQIQKASEDPVHQAVESFLDRVHENALRDDHLESVRSYHSARAIYRQLNARGRGLSQMSLSNLFRDAQLREAFEVRPEDELITYRSVNGNKARSKFSPNVNVQAMMSFEMMRANLSCAFFIESRDVRRFDSHRNRNSLWESDGKTPKGMPDQSKMMTQDLWRPLHAYVDQLKQTEYKDSGKSFFDLTNIVLTSEFGRSLHGNVEGILKKDISDAEKTKQIGGQDICAHWKVSSCAFLGGNVKGNSQYGGVGEGTLMAIPIMPDGGLDPNYDPISGRLRHLKSKAHPQSFIPNHGDVYATALALSGIDPKGKGRNERKPMSFIIRKS